MNVYPMRSVRTGDWKYIRNLHPEFYFTTHIDLGKPPDGAGYFASWREKAKGKVYGEPRLPLTHMSQGRFAAANASRSARAAAITPL